MVLRFFIVRDVLKYLEFVVFNLKIHQLAFNKLSVLWVSSPIKPSLRFTELNQSFHQSLGRREFGVLLVFNSNLFLSKK